MKIALFKSTVINHVVPWDEGFTNTSNNYVRVSEWVDVDFPMLPDDAVASMFLDVKAKRLSALQAEIAKLKGE